jgi:hypothetical protein
MPIDTDTISYLSLTTLRTATPDWIFKQIGSNDAAAILKFINNKANDPYLQIADVKKEILNTKLGPLAANGAMPPLPPASASPMDSASPIAAASAAYGGRKTKKVNSALKSWVEFVKKISKEENISYPKAMKRASKRKSEWKRGGGVEKLTPSEIANQTNGPNIAGGSRKRRGTRKSRGSRRR